MNALFTAGTCTYVYIANFMMPIAYRQCRESIREPVLDKEKANFCDFFRISKAGAPETGPQNPAFNKLNDLFK